MTNKEQEAKAKVEQAKKESEVAQAKVQAEQAKIELETAQARAEAAEDRVKAAEARLKADKAMAKAGQANDEEAQAKKKATQAKAEADQAEAEAAKAKIEADQAKEEAERAKGQADQDAKEKVAKAAKAKAEQAKVKEAKAKEKAKQAKTELEQAKDQVKQANVQAQQAKAEADQAEAKTEQANDEEAQAKERAEQTKNGFDPWGDSYTLKAVKDWGGLLLKAFFVLIVLFFFGMIVWQLKPGGTLLNQLKEPEVVRGFITFIIAIGTISIAIMLVLAAFSNGTSNTTLKDRFAMGKEVLMVFIGILGTIVGFYFGAELAEKPTMEALKVANVKVDQTNVNPGGSIILTFQVTGGKAPYNYTVTFPAPTKIEVETGVTTNSKVSAEITIPEAIAPNTLLTPINIEVTDTDKNTAALEIKEPKILIKKKDRQSPKGPEGKGEEEPIPEDTGGKASFSYMEDLGGVGPFKGGTHDILEDSESLYNIKRKIRKILEEEYNSNLMLIIAGGVDQREPIRECKKKYCSNIGLAHERAKWVKKKILEILYKDEYKSKMDPSRIIVLTRSPRYFGSDVSEERLAEDRKVEIFAFFSRALAKDVNSN